MNDRASRTPPNAVATTDNVNSAARRRGRARTAPRPARLITASSASPTATIVHRGMRAGSRAGSTVANVRSHFHKGGGNLAATGSVAFHFRRMGVFRLRPEGLDAEALELELIDHGLEEMGESTGEKDEPQLVIRCAFADFGQLQKALEDRGITPLSAESEYIPLTPVELPEKEATEVLGLIDRLEQDDDVQKVFHNLG